MAAEDDWRRHAACRNWPTELFFPTNGADVAAPKVVCATCPVVSDCADYAIGRGEAWGVWGGMSERERRRVRRRRQAERRVARLSDAAS